MLIGYIGAVRAKARQREALHAAGVHEANIYQGEDQLDGCMQALQPGDTLIVWRISQLGRDLRARIHIVDRLAAKGATLRAIASRGRPDDGALVSGVLAALAAFERDLNLGRNSEPGTVTC